jgi:DivIVA domain-containing protein
MPRDSVPDGLPAGPLFADDMAGVRFDLAFRGYRMDQVDLVLARLASELARRDAEIDQLRAGQVAPDG